MNLVVRHAESMVKDRRLMHAETLEFAVDTDSVPFSGKLDPGEAQRTLLRSVIVWLTENPSATVLGINFADTWDDHSDTGTVTLYLTIEMSDAKTIGGSGEFKEKAAGTRGRSRTARPASEEARMRRTRR